MENLESPNDQIVQEINPEESKEQDDNRVEIQLEDRIIDKLNREEIRHLKLIFRKFLNSRIGDDAAKNSTQSDFNSFIKTCINLVKSHINKLNKEEKAHITVDMEFTFIRRLFIDGIVSNDYLKELFMQNRISNMKELLDFSKVKYSKLAKLIMDKVDEQKLEELRDVPPVSSLTAEDKDYIKKAVSTDN